MQTQPASPETGYRLRNDTFALAYDFWREGGQLAFQLKNRTAQQLYFDWHDSYLQINGDRVYYDGQDQPHVVPPGDSVSVNAFILWPQPLLPTRGFEQEVIREDEKTGEEERIRTDFRYKHFSFSNSPRQFRHHLTMSLRPNLTPSFSVDHRFYIKEVKSMRERTFTEGSSAAADATATAAAPTFRSPKHFYVREHEMSSEEKADAALAMLELLRLIMLFAIAVDDASDSGRNSGGGNSGGGVDSGGDDNAAPRGGRPGSRGSGGRHRDGAYERK
jgi:hypothetical protein